MPEPCKAHNSLENLNSPSSRVNTSGRGAFPRFLNINETLEMVNYAENMPPSLRPPTEQYQKLLKSVKMPESPVYHQILTNFI